MRTKDTKTTNKRDESKKITERINRFFKTNNYLIGVGLVFMMILTMCDNRSYKKKMEKELRLNTLYLKKNIQTIGFLSANGMILTIDRKPIDYNDERIKKAIVNQLSQPFLQGAEQIGAGRTPKSAKEMIERNSLFSELYDNYTVNKDKISRSLSAVYETLSNLYYPEFITVKSQKILNFSVSSDVEDKDIKYFKAIVRYDITTKSWIIQLSKWVDQDINYILEFEGEINPSKYANSDNLLGVKLTNIKIPILQKPTLAELGR